MARTTRPVVGVGAEAAPPARHAAAHLRLAAGLCDAVARAGGLPLVVPPPAPDVDAAPLLDRLDGFVLTGGEARLLPALLARRLPLLAVGPGLLRLNAACGGTAYDNLPADLPRALPHRDAAGGGAHRHLVLVTPDTRLADVYGVGELVVVSDHVQAVRQAGRGLRVAAAAPDGVVEALESDDPLWLCVGVQWRPEAEAATALERQLFEALVAACRGQGEQRRVA
jgi:putative glutamine amidotransferase